MAFVINRAFFRIGFDTEVAVFCRIEQGHITEAVEQGIGFFIAKSFPAVGCILRQDMLDVEAVAGKVVIIAG